MMKYLVKDTPIRKNKKTYGVGKEFPYSDKDKKLLWNLTEVEEEKKTSKNISKDGPTKKVEATKKLDAPKVELKAVEKKKATAPKKVTAKKTNSKK